MSAEFEVKLDQARQNLPLERLMSQHGCAPSPTGKFPKCPFCQHKDSSGLFKSGDVVLFKCHYTSCPTGTKALDEIGFLEVKLGLNRREASITYLKESGVWQEQRLSPSILPGKRARKSRPPEPPANESKVQDPRSNGQEPIANSQVNGANGQENNLPQSKPGSSALQSQDEATGPSQGSADNSGKEFLEVGQEGALDGDSAAQTTSTPPGHDVSAPPNSHLQNFTQAGGATNLPSSAGNAASDGPNSAESQPPEPPSNIVILGGGGDEPPHVRGGGGLPPPKHIEALRYFHERSKLLPPDLRKLWIERGLMAETCAAMGYVSNVESNKPILEQMAEVFSTAVLMESGLWTQGEKANDPPRPNPKFYGWGCIERPKNKDDKGVWGFCYPPLIPYFDADGEVIHLRPHKDMAKGQLPRLYIVRCRKGFQLKQYDLKPIEYAIITEGEFKGAALWQALSQAHGDAVAIATLPGITMCKPLFGDIEDWLDEVLRESSARSVIVSFDNEEKGDPKLPGYTDKQYRRYDSQIWARYLALQLTREGYAGKVCVLPKIWRNAAGKADWDGAMAFLIQNFLNKMGVRR